MSYTSSARHQSFQLIGLVVLINAICIGLAFASYASGQAPLAALVAAYTLGLRHGFDADHIATIDNSIRRLGALKKQSIFTGFFFALGHSSVVFAGTIVVVLFSRALPEDASRYADIGATLATLVSVVFLAWLGLANIAGVLWPRQRRAHAHAAHAPDARQPESPGVSSGIYGRFVGGFISRIQSSWILMPVGMLFGLSFETASEVALLATAAHEGASGAPLSAIILYPCMFMAGMLAVDSLDGLLMFKAFNWAQKDALLRHRYNLIISLVTGTVALTIAAVQILSLYGDEGLTSGALLNLVNAFTLHSEVIGMLIAGVLLAIWIGSMCLARHRRQPLKAGS